MKSKKTMMIGMLVGFFFIFTGVCFSQDGKITMDEWTRLLESKRGQKPVQSNTADTTSAAAFPSVKSDQGIPVTLYWHMADDADVYLNGVPIRQYEPSFRTRRDEAPLPAFKASAVLRDGDVFTVGGRRGGSYGFMLIAADMDGRIVFRTDQQTWRVYMPGERTDWYLPEVANASPSTPVSVQPDPWYPQKALNKQFDNSTLSIWGAPSEKFAYLTARVTLAARETAARDTEGTALFTETFQGGLSATWEHIQVIGGNFGRFAQVGSGRLSVSVPAGNSWGKTGIMTSKPLFTLTSDMASRPLKLSFDFEPSSTTGYIIALSQGKNADVWLLQNVWFHWGKPAPQEGKAYLVNTQNNGDKGGECQTPAQAPRSVTLAVRPGQVEALTSDGGKITAGISWLKTGVPVYVYIFSHPWSQNESAAFVLRSIKVVQ